MGNTQCSVPQNVVFRPLAPVEIAGRGRNAWAKHRFLDTSPDTLDPNQDREGPEDAHCNQLLAQLQVSDGLPMGLEVPPSSMHQQLIGTLLVHQAMLAGDVPSPFKRCFRGAALGQGTCSRGPGSQGQGPRALLLARNRSRTVWSKGRKFKIDPDFVF